MKKALLSLLLSLVAICASAQNFKTQNDNFTFDKNSSITSWDGSDPASPPYPYAMGHVFLTGNQPGIDVPFQLGYLNDGYLVPCNQITWGQIVWTKGNGKNAGDMGFQPGSTSCPYFTGEYGTYADSNNTYDGFSVVAQYTVVLEVVRHRFGPPTLVPVNVLTGGIGTVTQIVTQ